MTDILTDAAAVGNATARAIVFRTRDRDSFYYEDSAWKTGFIGGSHEFEVDGVRLLDGRSLFFYYATGITPAMVAEAPYFSDIADRFEAFLKNSIFVAHNVDFDYGFLAREFRRIGRRFRCPRLCTCASMRKLYPGLRSYSLASLCDAFDLPLKQHHRALCDAEAAAELLIMINQKRQLLAAPQDV